MVARLMSKRCAADTITADKQSLTHALLQRCHGLYNQRSS
jgi:hypothetical protein